MPPHPHPTFARTTAILLAAGASRRMGMPKPLLLAEGVPLVERLTTVLLAGGVERVRVVTSEDLYPTVRSCLAAYPPAEVRVNPEPEAGMLSSVQIGLPETTDLETEATLVCPCDLPLLTPGPVFAILQYWRQSAEAGEPLVVTPVFKGKRGHPTLFGTATFSEVRRLNSRQYGLNEILKRWPDWIREVPVWEEGVLRDADTPEEWRGLCGSDPSIANSGIAEGREE